MITIDSTKVYKYLVIFSTINSYHNIKINTVPNIALYRQKLIILIQ
jgi:hypothetical protein